MSEYLNQHYVPQFYFKLFSRGHKFIHVLLKKRDRVILNASIKKQCAQNHFYGNKKIEEKFSILEQRHSKSIRKFLEIARTGTSGDFKEVAKDLSIIWEAVAFQRARTKLQVKKESPAMQTMVLEYFIKYLETREDAKENKELIQYIKDGNVRVVESLQHSVSRSISMTLEASHWISDLDFYVLRNHTDYPFVFSDSPVVFYNTYYSN